MCPQIEKIKEEECDSTSSQSKCSLILAQYDRAWNSLEQNKLLCAFDIVEPKKNGLVKIDKPKKLEIEQHKMERERARK